MSQKKNATVKEKTERKRTDLTAFPKCICSLVHSPRLSVATYKRRVSSASSTHSACSSCPTLLATVVLSAYGSALRFLRSVRQRELAPVGSLQSLQKATETTAFWETRHGVHTGNASVRLDTLQRERESQTEMEERV